MAATTNPWGLDENKYYFSVGGLSNFLSLADTLIPSKQVDLEEPSFIKMLADIKKLQSRYHKESLEYDKVTSIIKFSDLLLHHHCGIINFPFNPLSNLV